MPPQKRIFQQDILQAAADLVRKQGPQALSVRNLAGKMNCSTQPIYSAFKSMDELRNELTALIRDQYLRKQANSYKEVALSFLHFAKNEKNLFRLVYLRQRDTGDSFLEDPNAAQTIQKLSVCLDLPLQRTAELHRRMQYYCYSLAVMTATGYIDLSEEEIGRELTEYYRIMLSYYKQVKSEEELQFWLERSRNLMI